MKKKHGYPLLIILLWCVSPQVSKAQDSTWLLLKHWQELQTGLQRFNDLAGNFYTVNNDFGNMQQAAYKKAQAQRKRFSALLQIDTLPAAPHILQIRNGFDSMRMQIARLMVTAENNPALRKEVAFVELISQVEATENRLHLSTRRYNEVCKQLRRLDLIFAKPADKEQAPQINFN
jgi:hypothetical protein